MQFCLSLSASCREHVATHSAQDKIYRTAEVPKKTLQACEP